MQTDLERGSGPQLTLVRIVVVLTALVLWFGTQFLLGHRPPQTGALGDLLHTWTAPLNNYFFQHPMSTRILLIGSTAIIDALGIFMLIWGVYGPSVRPVLNLILVFAARQICQALIVLPPPDQMLWFDPGFPSLLVTYTVSYDFFFSGHTAIAVLGAVELARFKKSWLTWLGMLIALGEIFVVLILRAHYTMDVVAGAAIALAVAVWTNGAAQKIDSALNQFVLRLKGGSQ